MNEIKNIESDRTTYRYRGELSKPTRELNIIY